MIGQPITPLLLLATTTTAAGYIRMTFIGWRCRRESPQAGRNCLSVSTWYGTAVSVRWPAACRRTESAPAAFFNVQRPCRSGNQTRYCRWQCLSGRR